MSFFSIKKIFVLFGLVSLIFVFSYKQAEAACNTAPTIAGPIYNTGNLGDNLGYIITVRNNDDASCVAASRTFNLTSIKPGATWTDSFVSGTLTVNKGGGTGFTTYLLQSPAGAATGIYNFTITASDGIGSNTINGRYAVSTCVLNCAGPQCAKFSAGQYLKNSMLKIDYYINCPPIKKFCLYDYSNTKIWENLWPGNPLCATAFGINFPTINANSLDIWSIVLKEGGAGVCPAVPSGCIGLTKVVECLANGDCASNNCDLFTNTCIAPPACANFSCQAANTTLPCACGTATADAANPWCCAGNNAIYNAKALCQVGVCAPPPPPPAVLPMKPVKVKLMAVIISGLIDSLLALAAGLAILFLIIGGIRYLRSWGDTEQMRKAKNMIAYVVIGLVVILISYSVIITLDKIING